MKIIPLKSAANAIGNAEDFKAGDVYGIAWKMATPMHPTARKIDYMPDEEAKLLLESIKIRQNSNENTQINKIPNGLFYLISSYGVPIVWVTCDGTIFKTKLRHSDATSKHIEIAFNGSKLLSNKLSNNLL